MKTQCPLCNSQNTRIIRDVGSDIFPTDDEDVIEEAQHIEECCDCGAKRYISERVSMRDGPLPIWHSKWHTKEQNLFYD